MLHHATPVSPHLQQCWQELAAKEILCLGLLLPEPCPAVFEDLESLVSHGERQRARHFRHPIDRLRHLLGRAMLRQTLATPDNIEFPLNPWGKPEFPGPGVHLNISHGGREVWIALSKSTPVGIDVEDEQFPIPDIAELIDCLHPAEAAAIRTLPPSLTSMTFCRCWTRKEAILKALGQGLSIPLTDFCVAITPPPDDWLLQPPPAMPQGWTVSDLSVSQGHQAAIAALSSAQVVKSVRVSLHRAGHFKMTSQAP